VIQFADYRGDSLGLSRRAANLPNARYIVFCGVYFMAETAAILSESGQVVVQPVEEALCPMARLANAAEVAGAWEPLAAMWDGDLIPLTYQNSIAEVKAFVGQRGGAVCTSSNAAKLYRWALGQKSHILFIPDEHLGTNTALDMGMSPDEVGIWDPVNPPDPQTLEDARVVVWKGYCYVHSGFTPEDVDNMRAQYPDALVVVHPECPVEVVKKADASGSTTGIIDYIERAPAGSTVIVGTECHLVDRLDREYTDKHVIPLSRRQCKQMAMTTARDLLYVLEALRQGEPRHVVEVDQEIAHWARQALERMLQAS
jgi:quinolinate synthase